MALSLIQGSKKGATRFLIREQMTGVGIGQFLIGDFTPFKENGKWFQVNAMSLRYNQ
jgi:hypothetical protein